jgi:hypothetical protein
MSDIFLSYVLDDLDKADRLRTAFRQQGWTVWWSPVTLFRSEAEVSEAEVLDRELKNAKVIVALWSRHAARGPFSVSGSLEHMSPALPVLVLLDKAEPPPEFLPVRPFDLSDWDGSESHVGLQILLRHLYELIPTPLRSAAPPASFEELSLSEIQEGARQAIKEGGVARSKDEARFGGVFISYRRNEAAAYAGRLYDRLTARFGRERVFIDMENVGRGEDFVEAITDAAESCAVMIALISRQWARATGGEQDEEEDYVRLEVAAALGRKIPLIPIMIQGASMPRAKELPDDLAPIARRNAFELRDARWERDVEDLILDLEKLLNG